MAGHSDDCVIMGEYKKEEENRGGLAVRPAGCPVNGKY